MDKKRILYISANDGSDTRINKEIITYSKKYIVDYLGIGSYSEKSYALEFCSIKHLIEGNHKSPKVILKLLIRLKQILKTNKYYSIHVVDEQLFCFLIPILKGYPRITLDIFDSFFLKINKPNEKFLWLKKYIYCFANRIIVTDNPRLKLLPRFAQKKAVVIPNVPFKIDYSSKNENNKKLRLCYFGTLLQHRGSEFLFKLIENKKIELLVAGWIGDEYTKKLLLKSNVKYLGVLKQHEINDILARDGDYLVAIYPTNNLNNIYASPNKIYDAIHTKTPIIINNGTKVSEFVKNNNTGIVFNNFDLTNSDEFIEFLIASKNSFNFEQKLIQKFSWENYENILLNKFI
jgi:glycosyltransferase involved in cell wall biosynthesis